MVVPINPIYTAIGRTPLEPQFFYVPAQQVLYGQPFAQYDWPLPAGHQAQLAAQASPDYTWISNYTPNYQWPPPDTTKLFRGHLRSLPDQPYPPNAFQSWTQSFFIPRLPLPYGEQVTDLAPGQRPPEQVQLHSWTASYNLNLIGKDQLATGKQVYDLTVSQRLPELVRSWTYNQTVLIQPAVQKPLNQYDWQLSQGHQLQQQRPDFTFVSDWTPRFAFPPPDNTKIIRPHYRSLPDQPATPLLQQSVFQAYPALYTVTKPFNQYDWPTPQAPQQPAQSYTASYNLNLIGQDKLPTGEQSYDLVPRDYPRLFQTWIQPVDIALIAGGQHNQFDWPTPKGIEPDWRRSWTWNYNLNLIGQDQLPVGDRIYDLTPPDYQRQLQTWVQSVNLALTTGVPSLPLTTFSQYDWPVPRGYPPLLQAWVQNVSQALTLPPIIAQRDWPILRGIEQDWRRSWEWWYNLNLIGQDKFPPGKQIYDLAPSDYQRLFQTWIQSVNLSLLHPPSPNNQFDWPVPKAAQQPAQSWTWSYNLNLIGKDQLPFNQFDWPTPKAPLQPAQSFTASYDLNLIGQDVLPSGARSTDLTPADYQRVLQTWITSVNLALTTAPVQGPLGVVANQYDWPLPRSPAQPERTITGFNINLTPPGPPSTQLHQNPFFITMGRLSQLGNLPS